MLYHPSMNSLVVNRHIPLAKQGQAVRPYLALCRTAAAASLLSSGCSPTHRGSVQG